MSGDMDEIIEAFMEGDTRAAELRAMRDALEVRLKALKAERPIVADIDDALALERRIRQVREQIAALKQEEAVSQFVEDSLRVSLSRPMTKREQDEEV